MLIGLRLKLLASLWLVIIGAISVASFGVYASARNELDLTACTHMEQAVDNLSKQGKAWLNKFKTDIEFLAEMPLVVEAAQFPNSENVIPQANHLFQRFVEADKVYQSVQLLDLRAACVASSIPSRIGLEVMQKTVATRAYFQTAASGQSCLSNPLISGGTGRPCLVIAVPVRKADQVVAVLYAAVDLAFFGSFVLTPQRFGHKGKAYIFAPALDPRLPEEFHTYDTIAGASYEPPTLPSMPLPGALLN
jgi:C4-dicarboxylate-specific signal transduction histidine kinase